MDASAPADASAADDSGAVADAGAADASGSIDSAAADAMTSDSAASDAGILGITVKVDNVATTFAWNQSVVFANSTQVIQADDNPTSTHWHLQLEVTTTPQQICSTSPFPVITYTHFTGGVSDNVYSTKETQGYCNVIVTSTAKLAGDHARGTFNAGVDRALDAGPGV